MTFVQRIMPCVEAAKLGMRPADHPEGRENCIVISCEDETGNVVLHSHDDASIDPLERVNPDVPVASDTRP